MTLLEVSSDADIHTDGLDLVAQQALQLPRTVDAAAII
jgi:hypothetical protein